MRAAALCLTYTTARSFYALVTLVLIWGTLLWGSFGTLVATLLLLHLVTRLEEIPWLERRCRWLRTERPAVSLWPRLLSHDEDVHLLMFLALAIINYISAFYIYLNFDSLISNGIWPKVFYILGVGTMLGWTAGVNLGVVYHNHLHRGAFRSAGLNRWVGRLWTLPSGWPSFFWQYKHVVVHHRHVGEAQDWVQPRMQGDRYESIYHYVFCHWPWRYARHILDDLARADARFRRRALRELAIFLPFWLAPFAVDPVLGLGLWLYPHWFGSAFILGAGMYTQHAGGTTRDKHSASTTFLSEFFNLTMFNVGYHTEHHAHPSVHWSELPGLHERLRGELIQGGAHVVSYGSYRAASLLSALFGRDAAFDAFRQQHPEYAPGQMREVARFTAFETTP